MGTAFSNLVKIIAFCVLVSIIGLFILFNTNPYSICIDHPIKKKKDTHYICKPFNVEIQKPAPERKFRDGKF